MEVAVETIKVRLNGTANLLMHSARLANPMDPVTKRMKAATSKRKKTDEDYEEIMRIEFEGGMYHDEKLGPYLPGDNVYATIIEGAKLNKLGTEVKRAVHILEERIPLKYKGPRDIAGLWSKDTFRDVRPVTVGQSTTMRCRPKFGGWSVEFDVHYDPTRIDRAPLIAAIENAGSYVGLGDFRPRYGRFVVEVLS
jgi:hypothetical protein